MSVSTNHGGSKEWPAGEQTFRHFQVMSNEFQQSPYVLVCPSDIRQRAKDFASFNNSHLSYFIGLDADETRPQMWLSGDRNLVTNGVPVGPGLGVITPKDTVVWSQAMHKDLGTVGLADGSVAQGSSAYLPKLLRNTGTNINRLAVP